MAIKVVSAKLGNMRKPQEFVVYPSGDDECITVQSDKSIGRFDRQTRKGLLNTKGCYFHHLAKFMGAVDFDFPETFVKECIEAQPKKGDSIGGGIILG